MMVGDAAGGVYGGWLLNGSGGAGKCGASGLRFWDPLSLGPQSSCPKLFGLLHFT